MQTKSTLIIKDLHHDEDVAMNYFDRKVEMIF
jgi:hypothetical protein